MLRGEKVDLRSRSDADVAVLHAELYDDVPTRSRADSRPWVPLSADSPASPYRAAEPAADVAVFSVVECAGGELAGEALLWASICTTGPPISESRSVRASAVAA